MKCLSKPMVQMIIMALSEKIVQLRKEKDWSQTELGERVGVDQQIISGWERGKNMPHIESLVKLALLFEVSVDYILFDNVPREGTHRIDDFPLYELFRKAESLPEKEKEVVKELVSALLFRCIVKTAEEKSINQKAESKQGAAPLRKVAGKR
jgi:transcriptional regulator with XRE-family HTH domain